MRFMGNISIEERANYIKPRLDMKFRQAGREVEIDRSETCFAGKGTLTVEQYKEGMEMAARAQRE